MTYQSIRRQGLHTTTSSIWRRFGFAWVTGTLFIVSLLGHWWLAWLAYENEQRTHQAPVEVSEFLSVVGRDTLENWQSEFLQLLWQVAGLTYLFYEGSPQSREGSDWLECKIDEILKAVNENKGSAIIADLDKDFDRT
jgi:hypothetical protein